MTPVDLESDEVAEAVVLGRHRSHPTCQLVLSYGGEHRIVRIRDEAKHIVFALDQARREGRFFRVELEGRAGSYLYVAPAWVVTVE